MKKKLFIQLITGKSILEYFWSWNTKIIVNACHMSIYFFSKMNPAGFGIHSKMNNAFNEIQYSFQNE